MELLDVLAPALAFVLLAGALVGLRARFFSQSGRLIRAIRSVPRVALAEATEGELVRVVGRVEAVGEPMAAPLSGTSCVVYDVRVEPRGAPSALLAAVLVRQGAQQDFVVEDGTGSAAVAVEAAELLLARRVVGESGSLSSLPEPVARLVEAEGRRTRTLVGLRRRLRWVEGSLAIGESVVVVGVVRRREGGGSARLVLDGEAGRPLLVSNDRRACR